MYIQYDGGSPNIILFYFILFESKISLITFYLDGVFFNVRLFILFRGIVVVLWYNRNNSIRFPYHF